MLPLDILHACARRTVSLPASEIDSLRAATAIAHPDAATVTSCQRLECYSLEPCDCDGVERWQGVAALRHLAAVAAGLDSVVLGESQIMGQVRTAFADAPPALRAMADLAIASARELRRETDFASHAGHLLDRALKLADTPARGTLILLGTGAMGRLVAERGLALGFTEVLVAGRTVPKWIRPAFRFIPLSSISGLGAVDVVAGCLGSGAGELELSALPPVRAVAIDLGTPRNFAPDGRTRLVTIADMLADEESRPHARRRRTELRARLDEVVDRRTANTTASAAGPVGTLRSRVETVRQQELARMRRLHPEIPLETLDVLTSSLVNQIFHEPSQRLKSIEDPQLRAQLVALFAPAG